MANIKKQKRSSITENDKTTDNANPPNDRLKRITLYVEIFSKLFGLVTWPVIVLIIFLMFYAPIKEIVALLPEKISRSNEFTVAGVISLKIQEEAKASGNEELATIINGLSQEAIKKLITLGGENSHRVIGSGRTNPDGVVQDYFLSLSDFSIWKELEDRGLVQSTLDLHDFEKFVYSLNPTQEGSSTLRFPSSNLTKEQKDKLLDNKVALTDSGTRAYDIIIKVISDLIGEK